MTGKDLARLLREEVRSIETTESMMREEQSWYSPADADRDRLGAIQSAVHQFKFSLLHLAEALEKIE